MVLIISIVFIVGAVMSYFLPHDNRARTLAQTQKKSNLWVAQIDDKTISLDEFEREFSVHVFSLPIVDEDKDRYQDEEANKKRFLTNLINEYLIYNNAVGSGYLKRDDIKDLVNAVARRAVIQVYLSEKIEPLLEEVPDEQIEAIYNQNKKLFAGMDIDVARQQIKLQLLQKQYNDKLNELIDTLMGEAKVVRNQEAGL
jgi:hypothetical protein